VFQHGIDSPSLSVHLAAVRLTLPALTATRHYTVLAHTLIGEVAAGFQVRWGPQPDLPAIVYHHGIAEMPYDKSFRGIFRGSLPGQAHLVAIRAPFHRTWLDLLPGLRSMQHFLTMCAVAVRLGESVRQALQASDTRRVLPLLAQYDRDMLYDHHAACYAASGIPIATIARGHITGSLAFAALRAHVLTCMQVLLRKH
jgi:hypothetical protein